MEIHQKLADLCLLCSEFLGNDGNTLGNVTQWSQKPLYQMFESNLAVQLSQSDLDERQICQNCVIKFNELDEYETMADRVKLELLDLYNNSITIEFKPEIMKEEVEEQFEEFKQPQSSGKLRKKRTKTCDLPVNDPTGFTVTEVDGKKHYKCDICDKIVVRRPQQHLKTHSNERTFACDTCGQLFKSLKCLYGHRKTHEERVYSHCDLCGMKYLQKNQLRKHMDAIHLKTDHICEICGKSYYRQSTLQVHMLTHVGEKNVICTVCGFRTHTKSKMTRHMKSHTGERNYSCEICGKKFLYSYNVIAHVNHVHKGMRYKVDESKLICSVCGKKFSKQKKCKEHMTEVHNIGEMNEEHLIEECKGEVVEWIENY